MHVHHRHVLLPLQEFLEYLFGPFGAVFVRGYGGEVNVGVGAVLADGPGPSQYDFRRMHLLLDFPGYGQAFRVGSVAVGVHVGSSCEGDTCLDMLNCRLLMRDGSGPLRVSGAALLGFSTGSRPSTARWEIR